MIGAVYDPLLLGAALALLLEALVIPRGARRPTGELVMPFPTLGVALIATWAILGFVGPTAYGVADHRGGIPLLAAALGGAVVMAAGLLSQKVGRNSSRRHFGAIVIGGVCIALGGLAVPHLDVPFFGQGALPLLPGLLFTILWLFLVASLFEVLGLVPILSGLAAVLCGLAILLPFGVFQSFPGMVLCGSLIGVVLGRLIGQLLIARSRSSGKADILILGYAAGVTTLSIFAKSMVFAGFIIPVSALAIVFVMVVIHNLGGSLVLRRTPR